VTWAKRVRLLLVDAELGARGYVVKPVAFGVFMEAVRQCGGFWAVFNEAPLPIAG
jgi:hypothetical protein